MEPTITETVVGNTIVTEYGEPVYETIETYAAPQQVIVQPETVADSIVTEHVEPGIVIMEPTITETVVADTIVTEHVEPVYETLETCVAPQEVIVQPVVTESVAQDIVITQARIPIVTATPLKTKKKKHAGCC